MAQQPLSPQISSGYTHDVPIQYSRYLAQRKDAMQKCLINIAEIALQQIRNEPAKLFGAAARQKYTNSTNLKPEIAASDNFFRNTGILEKLARKLLHYIVSAKMRNAADSMSPQILPIP